MAIPVYSTGPNATNTNPVTQTTFYNDNRRSDRRLKILERTTGARRGQGDPNGTVVGSIGDTYIDTGGFSGSVLWVKETGTATNTGWVGK